jgi:hypothetical protein
MYLMTFTTITAWFAAYAAAAERLYGIPVGQPIVVTVEQDDRLCREATKVVAL